MTEKKSSDSKSDDVTEAASDPTTADSAETTQPESELDTKRDSRDNGEQATGPGSASDSDPEPKDTVADSHEPLSGSEKPDNTEAAHDVDPSDELPVASQPVPVEQVIVQKGGFVPTFLGGVVAAVIGFGVAQYLSGDWPFSAMTDDGAEQAVTQRLDAQSAQIEELQGRFDALSEGPDLSGLEESQAGQAAAIDTMSQRVDDVLMRLDDMEARLDDVESRPAGAGDSQAIAAEFQSELNALRDSLAQQGDEIASMVEDARTMEQNAEQTAQDAMQRAALTRVQTALDAGTGFDAALADLDAAGVAVPDALTKVAQDGVASLARLQDRFPDAARRALAASRQATDEGASGFGSFLRTQLGARSLEPREGDDPDAILSRAEAAAREGRLKDALAEIETLPEEGRAELKAWSEDATRRLEAVAAAEALAQDMN